MVTNFNEWMREAQWVRNVLNRKPFGFEDNSDMDFVKASEWLKAQVKLREERKLFPEAYDILQHKFSFEMGVCRGVANPRDIYVVEPYGSYNRRLDAIASEEKRRKRNQEIMSKFGPVVGTWLITDEGASKRKFGNYIPDNVWKELCRMFPKIYNEDSKNSIFLLTDLFFERDTFKGVKDIVLNEINTSCSFEMTEKGIRAFNLVNIKDLLLEGISYMSKEKRDLISLRYNLEGSGLRSYKEVGEWYGVSAVVAKNHIKKAVKTLFYAVQTKGLMKHISKTKGGGIRSVW